MERDSGIMAGHWRSGVNPPLAVSRTGGKLLRWSHRRGGADAVNAPKPRDVGRAPPVEQPCDVEPCHIRVTLLVRCANQRWYCAARRSGERSDNV